MKSSGLGLKNSLTKQIFFWSTAHMKSLSLKLNIHSRGFEKISIICVNADGFYIFFGVLFFNKIKNKKIWFASTKRLLFLKNFLEPSSQRLFRLSDSQPMAL